MFFYLHIHTNLHILNIFVLMLQKTLFPSLIFRNIMLIFDIILLFLIFWDNLFCLGVLNYFYVYIWIGKLHGLLLCNFIRKSIYFLVIIWQKRIICCYHLWIFILFIRLFPWIILLIYSFSVLCDSLRLIIMSMNC